MCGAIKKFFSLSVEVSQYSRDGVVKCRIIADRYRRAASTFPSFPLQGRCRSRVVTEGFNAEP